MIASRRITIPWSSIVLLLTLGCHTAKKHPVISVIPRQASESMWVTEHVGVNEAAAQAKVGIYWNGPTNDGDVEQQIVLAERAIRSGNMGMVLSPNNTFALNTVIQRSIDSGMSVVILGGPVSLKARKGLSFVLNDIQENGKLAADRMRDVLGGEGEIAILGFEPLTSEGNDRSSVFEAILARQSPNIHIVEKLKGPLSFGQAELAVEKVIYAHSKLSAIFTLGTPSTLGAVAAVRTTHTADQIKIIGCDHNLDLLYLLRQGAVDSVIAQNMRKMGALAVESIIAEQRGQKRPPYTYVKPILLTRQNIDDESIQDLLMMNWRLRP